MYQIPEVILYSFEDRGIKFPPIESCTLATNIETKRAFRMKLLKTAGITSLDSPVNGVKISTDLWFTGTEISCITHTMKESSLMEGGKGPEVLCMGSVLWVGDDGSRLFKEGVGKLLPFLLKMHYVGPISLTTIVTKDKVYATDITTTFSYSSIFILLEMYKGKVEELLKQLSDNKLGRMEFKSEIGIGIDLSVLPFPLGTFIDWTPIELLGFNKFNLKHFWGYDFSRVKDKYYTRGKGGRIGTVTSRGDNIAGFSPLRDAKRRVHRTIGNLRIPGLMYRRDIGDRVDGDKLKLTNYGWL